MLRTATFENTHKHTNTQKKTQKKQTQKKNTQTHKHTNTQTHKHTNTQTHKHTNTQIKKKETHKHTNTQIKKKRNTQTHKHTNTQTHKHTNTHRQAEINYMAATPTRRSLPLSILVDLPQSVDKNIKAVNQRLLKTPTQQQKDWLMCELLDLTSVDTLFQMLSTHFPGGDVIRILNSDACDRQGVHIEKCVMHFQNVARIAAILWAMVKISSGKREVVYNYPIASTNPYFPHQGVLYFCTTIYTGLDSVWNGVEELYNKRIRFWHECLPNYAVSKLFFCPKYELQWEMVAKSRRIGFIRSIALQKLMQIYTEITFRPGNKGALAAREHFLECSRLEGASESNSSLNTTEGT